MNRLILLPLLFGLVLCGTQTAKAQVAAGEWYSSASLGGSLATFAGDINDAKMRFGLAVGADIGYNVNDWFAVSLGLTNTYQGVGYSVISKNMYMDILSVPLMANLRLIDGLVAKAGIQPDFILSARMNSFSYTSDMNTVSLSAPLALSYEFATDSDGDIWFAELRYHLGLTKMNKSDYFANGWSTQGSIRNCAFLLTIGYKCDL